MSTQYEQAKEKKWVLKSVESQESQFAIAKIAEALQIHPIIAKLLYNRGYTDENAAKSFILMESEMLANPFDMKDVEKAISRIERAVKEKEKITDQEAGGKKIRDTSKKVSFFQRAYYTTKRGKNQDLYLKIF